MSWQFLHESLTAKCVFDLWTLQGQKVFHVLDFVQGMGHVHRMLTAHTIGTFGGAGHKSSPCLRIWDQTVPLFLHKPVD